jgi:hypothetical protein
LYNGLFDISFEGNETHILECQHQKSPAGDHKVRRGLISSCDDVTKSYGKREWKKWEERNSDLMGLTPKITILRKNVTRKRNLIEFTNVESTRECNDPQRKRSYFSLKTVCII